MKLEEVLPDVLRELIVDPNRLLGHKDGTELVIKKGGPGGLCPGAAGEKICGLHENLRKVQMIKRSTESEDKNGVLFARKKNGTLRLIFDPRRSNERF